MSRGFLWEKVAGEQGLLPALFTSGIHKVPGIKCKDG